MLLATLLAVGIGELPQIVEGSVTLSSGKPAKNAVVWLDGDKKGVPLKRAVIDQRDRQFVPHISVVTVGTEISFPNSDTVFHNVFAAFEAKKFDLGMYPRGKTKIQKFAKPGLVALMCSIHSEMSAYVMVVDTPFYTVAQKDGKFRIESVENGDYTVRAWHESGETSSTILKVPTSQPLKLRTPRK